MKMQRVTAPGGELQLKSLIEAHVVSPKTTKYLPPLKYHSVYKTLFLFWLKLRKKPEAAKGKRF